MTFLYSLERAIESAAAWLRGFLFAGDRSQVDEGIFQGGAIDSLPAGIEAVLDLEWEREDRLRSRRLRALTWMPIVDAPPFPGCQWLDAAVDTVAAWRRAGWSVLIHCFEGKSRSGMVDVAYHMKLHGWPADTALAYVKQKRPQTEPNPAFRAGLDDYQTWLGI